MPLFSRIPLNAVIPTKDDSHDSAGPARRPRVPRPFHRNANTKVTATPGTPSIEPVKQPYDAFLVLDVEATCIKGSGFDWPNEIIEFPICLLRWTDKSVGGQPGHLEVVDEFRSFVKPTWRPQLSEFCTNLTGITQSQIDRAPHFPKVLEMLSAFLVKHNLIDPHTGKRLVRFCWCSDGPFDIRDFVVKQCHISKVSMPDWMGDVIDVRIGVATFMNTQNGDIKSSSSRRCRSLNITSQLKVLGLPPFQGRRHSGIDDTRNIARIVIELARRGVRLESNTRINRKRRWAWMGGPGEIILSRV